MILKVFQDSGGADFQDIKEALTWVLQNHSTYNIVSINMSLGVPQTFHQYARSNGPLSSLLQALASQGVVTVSASGNDYDTGRYLGVSYPSSDKYSLSVGSVFARAGTYGGWDGNTLVPTLGVKLL